MRTAITSIAHYTPPEIYRNSFFEKRLNLEDGWIQSRTGVRERRIALSEDTSDLIVPAAQACINKRGLLPEELDCIIVATSTPDYAFPSTAAIVQRKLGALNAWGFDLSAACSGFVYALAAASKLVESGMSRRLLLCGADKMSSVTNFDDPMTAGLFGDAAGVVLLEQADNVDVGIIDYVCRMNGVGERSVYLPAGRSSKSLSARAAADRDCFIVLDGQAVFKAATDSMADISIEIIRRNNLTTDQISWLVPHQANIRIIKAVTKLVGINFNKVMTNVDRYGNTAAASIPLCLSEWYQGDKLRHGDRVILISFGAGYTSGGVYLRWAIDQ